MKKYLFVILIFTVWSCEEEKTTEDENEDVTFIKDFSSYTTCGFKLDVKQTNDLGYILAGCKNDSATLIKVDLFGDLIWQKTYGLLDYWGDKSVIQTSDGGYLFATWTGLLKTNADGEKEWIKKGIEGNQNKYPYYEDIIEHSNGFYYAVGGPVTPSGSGSSNGGQALLVKIDNTGNILKTKFYGGECEDDLFRSVIESNDNKLIMVGEKGHGNQNFPCSFNFKYYKDIYIVKTNLNGAVLWQQTHGNEYLEKGTDIVAKETDGYMIVGEKCDHGYNISTCSDRAKVMVLEIDENGNSQQQTLLNNLYFFESGSPISLSNTLNNGYVFVSLDKNQLGTWFYKWGQNESILDLKLDNAGAGGESIQMSEDGGFIIGTSGNIIIKTDQDLNF